MSPLAARSLISVEAISEGVMIAHFQLKGRKLNVICAYAPTNDYPDSEKNQFYSEVREAVDRASGRDLMLIGGDFNAQVGAEDSQSWQGSLGKFALHRANLKSNDMTQRLLNFCVSNELVLRNTFFNHKRIHLATWRGPAGLHENQIDFILTRRGDARYVQNCRVFRGAELETDHYLLVGVCRLQLRKTPREPRPVRYSAQRLHDDTVQEQFQKCMSAKFERAKNDLDAPIENAWLSLKLALHECADALLIDKQPPCKKWLSAKTMQLIAEKKSAYHLWLRYRK